MRRPLRRLARRGRRLLSRGGGLAREDGTATVEFVILFPLFMLVLANAVEASVLMSRAALLDRALDLAVRELRIGAAAPTTPDGFRSLVCAHASPLLLPDCRTTLTVELQVAASPNEPLMDLAAPCGSVGAASGLGIGNQLVMVRACVVSKPVVPNLGLGALLPSDPEGFRLAAVSAFVREPTPQGAVP